MPTKLHGAAQNNRFRGGAERERRHDHMIAGLDAERAHCQHQRVGAVGAAHDVLRVGEFADALLELRDLRAEDELTVFEHGIHPATEIGLDALSLRSQVDERDR